MNDDAREHDEQPIPSSDTIEDAVKQSIQIVLDELRKLREEIENLVPKRRS